MPELDCAECTAWLHPYLDNELGTEMAARVHQHIQTCPHCRRQYESLSQLQSGLHRAERYEMPELAQRRILASLPTRTGKSWLLPAASAAMLVASVALFMLTPGQQDALVDEVVSSHIRSLQEQHLTDVASSDKHTVKPWFTGKLDFSPPVFDLAEQGYPLIGGRLDYLEHQNAAVLAYRHNKHIINLFITPSSQKDSAATAMSKRGYHIMAWRKNHLAFELVSDLDAQELEDFAKLFMDRLQHQG